MKLVEFPNPSLCDIPAMLRRCADRIEAGEFGDVRFVGAVLVGAPPVQTIEAFLWGEGNELEMLGAFSVAHHRIMVDE